MPIVDDIDRYMQRLFPITRSITGDGNRKTLRILQEIAPLKIKEYKSGTKAYDWTIPDEWSIKDAWIKDANGNKLIDFNVSNIHVVGYSEPIHKKIEFEELKDHLYTHDIADAIPYRTSYYKRNWGFCTTQSQYSTLAVVQGPLEVYVDSKFDPNGSLSIGELLIPGKSKKEILISTYICHPSLANDNLSGFLMTAFLARELLKLSKSFYSYRVIWVPETIGAISYCARNELAMKEINKGIVVTTVGGPGKFGYKQSFDISHSLNAVVEEVFIEKNIDFITYPFDIHGSDERQYSSIGFRINTISITKDKYYEYPQYHTSLDDLDYVSGKYIAQSLSIHLNVLSKIDDDVYYLNQYQNCEVMLSKHNLYPEIGGDQIPNVDGYNQLDLILWILFLCDGATSVRMIARRLNIGKSLVHTICQDLHDKNIIKNIIN